MTGNLGVIEQMHDWWVKYGMVRRCCRLAGRWEETPTADFGQNQTLSEAVSFFIKLDHNMLATCNAQHLLCLGPVMAIMKAVLGDAGSCADVEAVS